MTMEILILRLRKLLMGYTHERIDQEWDALYAALSPFYCAMGQRLATRRGDICFLAEGTLLKLHKTTVTRIIKSDQLLFVPLRPKAIYFQALTPCKLLLLPRVDLYDIIEAFPQAVRIYDSLLDLWHEQCDERLELLELSKVDRIKRFRELHKEIYPYMVRRDIANYISVSEEYLRKNM